MLKKKLNCTWAAEKLYIPSQTKLEFNNTLTIEIQSVSAQ